MAVGNQNRADKPRLDRMDLEGDPRIGMRHFVKESRIAAAPGAVFAFHESPGAFEKLIPPWEKVTIVEAPVSLRPGTRAVLRTRLGPLDLEWVAEHTEYEPGRLFADRQVRGPFAYWYHRHRFLEDGQGGTLLRDEIDYRPPLGRIGEILGSRLIDSKMKKMFDYRHAITKQIMESAPQADAGEGRRDAT